MYSTGKPLSDEKFSAVRVLLLVVLLASILASCTGNPFPSIISTPQSTGGDQAAQALPRAEVLFVVQSPGILAEGQGLHMEFLDEVTGLALNASRVPMETQDGATFAVKIAFPIGSVLKYRYVRDNDPVGVEYTTRGQQVRYRLFVVDGPSTVRDTISAWRSEPSSEKLGRINGQVALKSNNAPVVNALVTAGGMHTVTSSDGSFILEGLPSGTHNLVIYSLDGAFRPFQQGAVVASDSTTPALALVDPIEQVEVTFIVTPPAGNFSGVPIRMIGNIYPLGNTFADLNGGANVLASRSPYLTLLSDGRYSLRIMLPVGLDLRYKYTLGDGFWNAERTSSGPVHLRQLIVPNRNITIEDRIETWSSVGFGPITFTVTAPANTPPTDTLSIQFNPYGWTEPIPMWPVGENRWLYILYSPLDMLDTASYRYCRNEQCGVADDVETSGANATGKTFKPQPEGLEITDTITGWVAMDPPAEPSIVSSEPVSAREANFMAGVAMSGEYHPSWQPYVLWGFQNVKSIGSNTVILTPTWHLTHQTPPVIVPQPGRDPLWFDLTQLATQAQQSGLGLVIHPVLRYDEDPDTWWQNATRDDGWWQTWFGRYRTFLLYHADLATQTGAKLLIIGDETIVPALPGGTLADGSLSGVPADVETRWQSLIEEVRARYAGKIAWAVTYDGEVPPLPDFVSEVDSLYVVLSGPLVDSSTPAQADLDAGAAAVLDAEILPLQEATNLPVLLAMRYPSALGAADGCVGEDANCLLMEDFTHPASLPNVEISLKEQADAYSAVLSALNQRSWIGGFFAEGYFPPVELRDASVSVRGKPAFDVLWYWYPRLFGQISQ